MEQPTLAQACSVFFLANPSFARKFEVSTRKHITTSLPGFANPLVWWEVRAHNFLVQHWNDPVASVAYLPYVSIRNKVDVNMVVGFLTKWVSLSFGRFGRPVGFSTGQKAPKTNLGPISLGELTADYLFTTPTPASGASALAVLEIRAPGALDSFSLTQGPEYSTRRNDNELAKHARA